MLNPISHATWNEFEDRGYVKLGSLDLETLGSLQERINAIMLGKAPVDYERMLMQLDSADGAYENAGAQTKGFKGATLNYRKIQDLEYDPRFLKFLQEPVFKSLCERVYGAEASVAVFRAMFMNKPAHQGTFLPWHQDRWTSLSEDPAVTVWTALDPATKENGCVQVIPGSHKQGLINPSHSSGFLSKAQSEAICTDARIVHLELQAGEVVLLHNYLLHASDINRSSQSRRAFSVCYMNAATLVDGKPCRYPIAFGKGALRVDEVTAVGRP